MRKAKIARFILYASLLLAVTLNLKANPQEEALKKLEGSAPAQEACADCQVKVTSPAECLKLACAPFANQKTTEQVEKEDVQNSVDMLQKNDSEMRTLIEALTELMDTKIEQFLATQKRLHEYFSDKNTKVLPKYKYLHSQAVLFDAVVALGSSLKKDSSVLEVDKEAFKKRLLERFSKDIVDVLLPTADAMLKQKNFVRVSNLISGSSTVLEEAEAQYPGEDLQEVVKKELEKLKTEAESAVSLLVKQNVPKEIAIQIKEVLDEPELLAVNESSGFGARQIEDAYISINALLFGFSLLLDSQLFPVLSNELYTDMGQLPLSKDFLTNSKKLTNHLEVKENRIVFRDNILSTLASTYAVTMETLPTDQEVAGFKKVQAEAIQQIESRFLSKFSEKTRAVAKQKLAKLVFDYPKSKEQYKKFFIQVMRNEKKELDSARNLVKSLSKLDLRQNDLLKVSGFSKPGYDEKSLQEDFIEAYASYVPEVTEDQAYPLATRIAVSPFSIKYPEQGRAILAHEIGHFLYRHVFSPESGQKDISKESFSTFVKTWNCVTDQHLKSKTAFIPTPSENLRIGRHSSEDFADLVSAVSFPSLNLGCSLVHQDTSLYPSENPIDGSAHSAVLFRVLHIEQVRTGKISQSCQDAISAKKLDWQFSDCKPSAPQ